MFNVKGGIVALVTPFHEDGSVNFDKLKEILEWRIENEMDGILVLGITGGSSTVTHEGGDAVVEHVLQTIKGGVPVIVGNDSSCTEAVVDKGKEHAAMGADALLVISLYYDKVDVQGMIAYFAVMADTMDRPIILYSVPGRTGCSINEEVVEMLSEYPNTYDIKEASGNTAYAAAITRYLNDSFVTFSGNDDMIIPLLSFGGSNVIPVWANIIPREVHEMVHNYLNGNAEAALVTQLHYLDLIHVLFIEVGPIPIKEALNMIGKTIGECRLPLYGMEEAHRKALLHEVKEAGLC